MIDCYKLLQRLRVTSHHNEREGWYNRAYAVFHGRAPITQGMAHALLVGHGGPPWQQWVGYHIDAMACESRSNSQTPPFIHNLEQKVQWLETRLAALESRLTSGTPSLVLTAKASGEGPTCTPFSEELTDSATCI